MLLKAYDRDPAKLAIVFPAGSVTYGRLVDKIMLRARGLWALGVRPRDHVGILLPSGIDFIESFFAVAMCGAVSVLMNARYKAPELCYVAENADLTTIITDGEVTEHVDLIGRMTEAFPEITIAEDPKNLRLAQAPKLQRLVLLGGKKTPGFIGQAAFEEAAADVDVLTIHKARLGVRIRDICMILYTSGTSANPKGCLLSHEAIVREANNLGRNRWEFNETDRVWSPLPLFHVAALLAMLSVIDAGGTFYGLPHFDAGESLKQIGENKVTFLFLPFVTFHQAMIAHPDFERTDMSAIRSMNSCFATMPESLGEIYAKKVPHTLQFGTFGMTEASGIVATGGYDMPPEMGFLRLGTPLVGIEVRIVDVETGKDLAANERGEVLIRGYNLFDGYYRDPEKTAQALDADGWYHSGDIGSLDEHGHIMFHGRFKDMLKVGGENVAAAEVEAVLTRHPMVLLAQVVGIPDHKLAEIPAAFVELKPGGQVTEEDLIAFVKKRMASFKVPRYIRFVDEWPMSASKIQKFKLRKDLMAEFNLTD
ncbi:AMP-dependent synthetase [Acidocella aquatica]|uniref:AMP-dependent synthetase n=2 Tax=Acidocella aquatica TaxID=1922313 RepID=A0ABQ6ADB0_9PROT|nr:AMP-dependent synthetase [Acidocella aquatica]